MSITIEEYFTLPYEWEKEKQYKKRIKTREENKRKKLSIPILKENNSLKGIPSTFTIRIDGEGLTVLCGIKITVIVNRLRINYGQSEHVPFFAKFALSH